MKPTAALRIVLVDDQAAIRAGLKPLLEATGRVTVIAEAGDGAELLRVLDVVRPDAVLLDLSMPGMDGLEVLRALSDRPTSPPVVALTMHDDASHVDRALSLGAAGYVLKSARPDVIVGAVEAAVDGGAFIEPSVAGRLLKRHMALGGSSRSSASGVSPRQRDLLRGIAMGIGNKDIAHRLGLSEETVKSYLKDLYPRIGVSGRAAAAAWAIRQGIAD